MRRTYRVPLCRAGLVGLMAALVLLCLPGTSIAGGASDTSSASKASSTLLQYGAGYGKADGVPPVRAFSARCGGWAWSLARWMGCTGPGQRPQSSVSNRRTVAADGIVGPQTRHALTQARSEPLRRGVGFVEPNGSPRVRALQAKLRGRGFGPARWTASSGRGRRRRSNASSAPAGCP